MDDCDCEPGYILHWQQAGLSITAESIVPASYEVILRFVSTTLVFK